MSAKMVEFLKNKFNEIKRINTAFSVRTFAIRAGISSGAMSEILAEKRPLTRKLAQKIATNLKLNPTERTLFFAEQMMRDDLGIKKVRFLNQAQFQYITDPAYFNFLALMDTSIFKNDIVWISKKLEISTEKVNLIIIRFKELKIIEEQDGSLLKTKDTFSTTDDIKDSFVTTAHMETLKSASRSIASDPVTLRDFTSFCFPADPRLLPEVKLRIRAFQDEIAALMRGNQSSEVYKLAINLFPQSKPVEEKRAEDEKKIKNF